MKKNPVVIITDMPYIVFQGKLVALTVGIAAS